MKLRIIAGLLFAFLFTAGANTKSFAQCCGWHHAYYSHCGNYHSSCCGHMDSKDKDVKDEKKEDNDKKDKDCCHHDNGCGYHHCHSWCYVPPVHHCHHHYTCHHSCGHHCDDCCSYGYYYRGGGH